MNQEKMMDHKAFLASLPHADRDHLTARSDAKGLAHLAVHWGAIILCGLWIYHGGPLWQGMLVVQGILLVFLFTLLHETSHKTPFASGWINTVVGHICGLVLFLPAAWFRYFHLAHHRFTQVPGKDPELEAAKPKTRWQFATHISGIPVWISHLRTLLRNAMGQQPEGFVPQARRAQITTEARAYLGVYAALLAGSLWLATPALLIVWGLPLLLGQPFLRLYLLAEHGRCPMVANMFENTRTTYTNALVRAVAWNMPYHAEHHSYPQVPFHKLPELHERIQPHLQVTAPSYAAFHSEYVRDALD